MKKREYKYHRWKRVWKRIRRRKHVTYKEVHCEGKPIDLNFFRRTDWWVEITAQNNQP